MRSGKDEPVGVVIHMWMEITQGNSCMAIFSQTTKSILFLSFLFFLLQNRITEGQNKFCGGRGWAQVGGGRRRGRRMNEYSTNNVYTCM
jgi:hypothetical protein